MKFGGFDCACSVCGEVVPLMPTITCPDCGAIFCEDCAPDGEIPEHDCEEVFE